MIDLSPLAVLYFPSRRGQVRTIIAPGAEHFLSFSSPFNAQVFDFAWVWEGGFELMVHKYMFIRYSLYSQ